MRETSSKAIYFEGEIGFAENNRNVVPYLTSYTGSKYVLHGTLFLIFLM